MYSKRGHGTELTLNLLNPLKRLSVLCYFRWGHSLDTDVPGPG